MMRIQGKMCTKVYLAPVQVLLSRRRQYCFMPPLLFSSLPSDVRNCRVERQVAGALLRGCEI